MQKVADKKRSADRIVKALRAAGHEAYFVGGCVRDLVLKRKPYDFDIASSATPDQVEKLFPRTVAVGKAFGVIVVREGNESFEVATFREDLEYKDGRRPEGVKFSTAKADALRRDFTVNGLFYDPVSKKVLDWVGGLADADERACLRLLTPLAKLWTGKLAVGMASECCEAFGGAGYIENTGIPQLLRDAQVYPIWEGTTNVLALDSLRAIASVGVEPLLDTADALLAEILKSRASASLEAHAMSVCSAIKQASQWLHRNAANADAMQAGARDLAFTLARSMAAALLCRQAAYSIKETGDMRPSQALARFIGAGLVSLPDAGGPHPLDLLDPPH